MEVLPTFFCHETDQPLRSLGLTITLNRAVFPQKTFSKPDIIMNGLSVTQKIKEVNRQVAILSDYLIYQITYF